MQTVTEHLADTSFKTRLAGDLKQNAILKSVFKALTLQLIKNNKDCSA